MVKIKKVASVHEIMDRNIQNFITDTSERYKLFQESAPTFVTYYNKSAYASTYDKNFESHNEAVGDESPVGYFRIEEVPVYDLQVADFTIEETDTGRKGEYTSTCYLLPDTVVPNVDDMMDIRIHGKRFLLRVTSVDIDNHENKKFYKLSIKLSNMTIEDIEKQVVREQVLDFELIGRTNNPVLNKNWKEGIDTLKATYDDLLSSVRKTFYGDAFTAFIDKRNNFIDQHLNEFIRRNGLNNSFANYRDAMLVSESISSIVPMHTYKKLVYFLLEREKLEDFPNLRIATYIDYAGHMEFNYFYKDKVSFAEYIFIGDKICNPCLTKDPKDVKILLASMDMSPICFPYFLFNNDQYPDKELTYNEQFFVDVLEFLGSKDNGNRNREVEKLIGMIEDIEPVYTATDDLSYSREYYSSVFTLFALKKLYAFLTDTK